MKFDHTFVKNLNGLQIRPTGSDLRGLIKGYWVVGRIGSGGFADVYKVVDEWDEEYAVKVPKFSSDDTMDGGVLKKFQSEGELWSKLIHSNIVKVNEVGEVTVPHIVMELMEGGSLRSMMKENKLTIAQSVTIMLDVLEGLSYAHRMGTIHRDIKPENILFTEGGVAKITDWGIGKAMLSGSMSQTMGIKGTLHYCAPEQIDRKRYGKVDWQTDVFQAGILFYEMLTGRNPFRDEEMATVINRVLTQDPPEPSSINEKVTDELDDIIMTALEKDKKSRWESGSVMLHELKKLFGGSNNRKYPKESKGMNEEARFLLDEISKSVSSLERLNSCPTELKAKIKELEKLNSLHLYEDVIENGERILSDLKEMNEKAMKELRDWRASGYETVKDMLKQCVKRDIDLSSIQKLNDDAIGSYQSGDHERSDKLIPMLRSKLEDLIILDDRKRSYRKKYKSLLTNRFSVKPPLGLMELIEKDVEEAFGQLSEWEERINSADYEEQIRKEEEKRKMEEEKRRREYLNSPLGKWETSKKKMIIKAKVQASKTGIVFTKYKYNLHEITVENRKNFLGMDFVKIPGKDFYMGKFTVRQKDWKAVMRTEPWIGKEYVMIGDDYPATDISWNDCAEFISKLNKMEGVNSYRMPTEEEWEHACRAGSITYYCFGDDEKLLKDYAWYSMNAWNIGEKYAHKVGLKKPNAWGLYDMHGNVWEWCSDLYDYEGSGRVVRGGNFDGYACLCRSANRYLYFPVVCYYFIGLRLVRVEA